MRTLACVGLLMAAFGANAQPANEAQARAFAEALRAVLSKHTKFVRGAEQPSAIPEALLFQHAFSSLEAELSVNDVFEVVNQLSEESTGDQSGGLRVATQRRSIPGYREYSSANLRSFCEDVANRRFRNAYDIALRATEMYAEDSQWILNYFSALMEKLSQPEVDLVRAEMSEFAYQVTHSYMDELSFAAEDPQTYEWFMLANCEKNLLRLNDPEAHEAIMREAEQSIGSSVE